MALGLDGKEKPFFKEGARVFFNYDGKTKGVGKIRGKSIDGLIDFWIVEVVEAENLDKALYPWSCIVVPHPQLQEAS